MFILLATSCLTVAGAAPLSTLQNSTLAVPGSSIASAGFPGATNLAGSNFLLSAVAPVTFRGGRASLIHSLQWVRHYNGGPGSYGNAVFGAVIRRDSSVVVTGYSSRIDSGYDFATICYAADGTPLWTNRYDGPAHRTDIARLLATDAAGNVWVAGQSMRYPTNSTLTDVVVIKYASDGTPAWTNRYSSFETNGAYPIALVADGSGNVYVAHWSSYWRSGTGTPVDAAIIKYDPLGNVLWAKHYPRAAPDSGKDLYDPGLMALDDAGNLLVAGTTGQEHWNTGSSIVKFDADGKAVWTNYHAFGFMPSIKELSVDHQGNAILTGETFSHVGPSYVSYVVLKCSKDGVSLWTNVLAGPVYDGGSVPQTVPDAVGNVLLTGGSPGTHPGFYRILKISGNGLPLWTNQTADFGPTNSGIQNSKVDSAGNLYLTGYAPAPGTGYLDFITVKYSGDGQPLGTNRFNGAGNRDDIPFTLALDGTGNVYVAGRSESQFGNLEFATVKYAPMLLYSPPKDFTGLDMITCTLTDNSGSSATGSVEVLVSPGSFQFSLSPTATRLTSSGMQLEVKGVPGTNAVVLETSLDLVNWQRILTNSPDDGAVQFLDPVNIPKRFYRAFQEQ